MPSAQGIIEQLGTPPLAALQQVLDLGGPYAGGDHVLGTFNTNGAFLLPAGTYPVAGTYGILVRATTIPVTAGRVIGFNGIVSGQDISADTYHDRICQICLVSNFPISGAKLVTDTFDVHMATQIYLWESRFATFDSVALHVFPNWAVDLYYMCVL